MDGHNLVAVYNSRQDAERVRDRLIEIGIPMADIKSKSTLYGYHCKNGPPQRIARAA
jgi:hypothetical protein